MKITLDEDRILALEEYSIPISREGESIVTFSPGGGEFNTHQIPEWAYQKLLSDTPRVETATQSSDCLRIRVGFLDRQSAGIVISRICELENRIEIENIRVTPYEQLDMLKFPVIADIRYMKDNIDGLLYALEDIDIEVLSPADTQYIIILR